MSGRVCKKGVLRNFIKYTGKHLCKSLFFNEVSGLRPATLLKTRLLHRCFPVNFVKFLRTPILTEHLHISFGRVATRTTLNSSTFPLTQQHTNKHLLKRNSPEMKSWTVQFKTPGHHYKPAAIGNSGKKRSELGLGKTGVTPQSFLGLTSKDNSI